MLPICWHLNFCFIMLYCRGNSSLLHLHSVLASFKTLQWSSEVTVCFCYPFLCTQHCKPPPLPPVFFWSGGYPWASFVSFRNVHETINMNFSKGPHKIRKTPVNFSLWIFICFHFWIKWSCWLSMMMLYRTGCLKSVLFRMDEVSGPVTCSKQCQC